MGTRPSSRGKRLVSSMIHDSWEVLGGSVGGSGRFCVGELQLAQLELCMAWVWQLGFQKVTPTPKSHIITPKSQKKIFFFFAPFVTKMLKKCSINPKKSHFRPKK